MAKNRTYTPWEIMMISEWVAETFPDVRWETNVRLGPMTPRNGHGRFTKDELRLLGVWRRRVDALVYLPDRLLLVESVMRSHPGKLSMLELYELLIRQTLELRPYWHLRIQKVLLYVIEDPALLILCKRKDILAIQFVPSFFDEWFAHLRPRDRRVPKTII